MSLTVIWKSVGSSAPFTVFFTVRAVWLLGMVLTVSLPFFTATDQWYSLPYRVWSLFQPSALPSAVRVTSTV